MRLIDKDMLWRKFYSDNNWEGGEPMILVKDVLADIYDFPLVDVVPVVRGKWTASKTEIHDGELYCSICDFAPPTYFTSSFCPNCGANMKVDKEGATQ